jgi:hypothetical protein
MTNSVESFQLKSPNKLYLTSLELDEIKIYKYFTSGF